MNEEIVQTEELETEVVTEVEKTGESEGEITANDETTQEAQGELSNAQEGQGKPPSKSRNAKARLRRKLDDSEAGKAKLAEENQQLKERLDALDTKLDGVINPPPPRPDRVDFETEEDYEDQLFNWRDSQKSTAKEPQTPTEPVQNAGNQQYQPSPEQQETIDSWVDSCDDAAEKYEDFESVVMNNQQLPISPIMRDALMESDVGTEVAYYLGKNISTAGRIAKMSIVGQINEINELSKKFTKTTTSAPEPIDTVGKGQASSSGKKRHPILEGATFE